MSVATQMQIYSDAERALIQKRPIPEHVALIMDGNRRWAEQRGLQAYEGHWQGAETLLSIVKGACCLGIKVLTVFAFSTENWRRSALEIRALMQVIKTHLIRQRPLMVEEGIRLNVIGDLAKLPSDVRKLLNETMQITQEGRKLDLVLALNYGGRDELTRAMKAIVADCMAQKITLETLSEELFGQYLDTAKWKDPELLIRTSGENRLSNFLLWQISYAEVVVTDVLWPDFSQQDFLDTILEYQQREMRLGK